MGYLPTIIIIFCLSLAVVSKDREIGERSILLPVDYGATHRVQHLVEAYGGCYHWNTNEPDVLKISPIKTEKECESRALVEVQKEGAFVGPLFVSATDQKTGEIIKAVVRLSKLQRIQILTKFRIMNLYQVQQFYLIGYDQLGNSFSSLEGLKFQWTLEQRGRVAQKISIRQSNIFQQTNYRRSLQQSNYQTDMLVVKALNIGEIQLVVKLNEPNYEHISTSIRLSVQERFDIIPSSPVYMLAGSKLKFNLLNHKGEKISLPASYYSVDIDGSFKTSDELAVVSPSFETKTKLIVKDTRTEPPYTNQVDIYTLNADSIQVLAKSYVIIRQTEPFKVSLFNNRKLLKGGAAVKLESDFFLDMANSSFIAREKGVGKITASYNGLTYEKRIIANLQLKPVLLGNKIVLPPGQTFQLKIIGGSGSYEYSMIDLNDVAFIHNNGIISAKNPGKAKVLVVDNNDNNNRVQIDLIVDRVSSIKSFDEKLESGLGDQITALAIAKPENERQYTQCNELSISFFENDLIQSINNNDLTLQTIVKIHQNARQNPELANVLDIFRQGRDDINLNDYRDYIVGKEIEMKDLERLLFIQDNFGICKALKAKPLIAREGQAQFAIQGEKDYISTPFKVKIYDELGIKDHSSSRILLTPGSNFIWKPQNGAEESIYYLNDIKIKQGDSIVLSCSEPGEVKEYDIKVIHQISQKLPRPFTRYIQLTVQCLKPSSLKFKVDDNILDNGQLYSSDNEPFIAQLRGFDHLGRQFYNISSLDYNWNLDGLKRSDVSPKDNIYKFTFVDTVSQPHINVKTTGSRYNGVAFPQIQANLYISKTRPFQLLLKDSLITKSLVLLASPNQKHLIRINYGSNNFEIKCPHPNLLKCSLNPSSKTIEISPLKKGNTKLIVTDIQQSGRPFLQVNVKIVNPIQLKLTSNVTLVEQKSAVKLNFEVYGQDNLLIDKTQYQYLGILARHDCDVQKIDQTTFRALRRGKCSVNAVIPEYNIGSNTINIQVFPKFSINIPKVHEEEIDGIRYYFGETRVPYGCNTSLIFLGGPFGIGKLSYEAYPSNILEIEELNLRTFRLIGKRKGQTNLKFVLRDTQKDISIVNIKVIVKDVESIELQQGNRQIHERATVRLIPDILIDGHRVLSCQCPIQYQWKTDNSDVIQLRGLNNLQSNLGLNVTGKKKGYAKIELIPVYGYKFPKQQILIQVVEVPTVDLSTYVHQGKVQPTSLLIPPNSGYSFNSSYHVETVSPCENLMQVVGNDIDTLNDKGGSVIKLRTVGRQNSVSYMSVHVQRIHSVMIENPLGKLSIQKDTEIRIPFYVLDSFGRLFPNNLKGIEYEVRITDPAIASAEISNDNQEIILRGYHSGRCNIHLSIAGQPEIYDVVQIETMILITPISPVSVHVGGSINFKTSKGNVGEWISENPFLLQIDRRTGKSLALREGSTQISYYQGIQYKSRINVFQAVNIDLLLTNDELTNYKGQQSQLRLSVFADKGKGIQQLKNFNQLLDDINNNIIVKCSSLHPLWFQIQCSIQNINDREQLIFVYPKGVKQYPNDQMPSMLEFEVKLQSGTIGQTFLTQRLTHPFIFQFRIPKHQQHIYLNARQKTKTIQISTNSKLGVYSQYSRSNWLSTQFIPERSIQIIKLDFNQQTTPVKTSIKLMNHLTKQSDQITVTFAPTSYASTTTGFSWINIVIIIMLIIIAMLIFCACMNKDDVFYSKKDD